MTALTDRLRESAAPLSDPDLNDEAADELERFQTSLVRLKMQLDQQREYHAAELADATAEHDHAVEQAAKNCDEVIALRAEAAGLREDAERYRLLRRGQHWSVLDGVGDNLRGEALDAAVDAARKGAA